MTSINKQQDNKWYRSVLFAASLILLVILTGCDKPKNSDIVIVSPEFPEAKAHVDKIAVSFAYYDETGAELILQCNFDWARPVTNNAKLKGSCPSISNGTYRYRLEYRDINSNLLLASASDIVEIKDDEDIRIVPALNKSIDPGELDLNNLTFFLKSVEGDESQVIAPDSPPLINLQARTDVLNNRLILEGNLLVTDKVSIDWGDGTTAEEVTSNFNNFKLSHDYTDETSRTIQVTATNEFGETKQSYFTLFGLTLSDSGSTLLNKTNNTLMGVVGKPLSLSIADTFESYKWELSDSTSTVEDFNSGNLSFGSEGDHTVSVTVTDSEGNQGSIQWTITIEADVPTDIQIDAPQTNSLVTVFDAEGSSEIQQGDTIEIWQNERLDFQSTINNIGNEPSIILWDFAGASENVTTEDPGQITFSIPGTFTITLTLTDYDGDESKVELPIKIKPLVGPGPMTKVNSSTVRVYIPISSGNRLGGNPEHDIARVFVAPKTHAPKVNFAFNVLAAPVPVNDIELFTGQKLDLEATGINSDITAYDWDLGGQGSSTTTNPDFISFDTAGVYTVTLTTTHADTSQSTYDVTVIVTAIANDRLFVNQPKEESRARVWVPNNAQREIQPKIDAPFVRIDVQP